MQAVEKAIEDINSKLEKDIKKLSLADYTPELMAKSISLNDQKVDIFASELEVRSNDSAENDLENSRTDFCDNCLKAFKISLTYSTSCL